VYGQVLKWIDLDLLEMIDQLLLSRTREITSTFLVWQRLSLLPRSKKFSARSERYFIPLHP
jgi:hypothetical protein